MQMHSEPRAYEIISSRYSLHTDQFFLMVDMQKLGSPTRRFLIRVPSYTYCDKSAMRAFVENSIKLQEHELIDWTGDIWIS